MAEKKAPRLKVFQARFGFYDSVVAVPSQAAALRAWETHQNLFADGQAEVTTDAAAVEAALAHPGTPLRRALGSKGAFEVEPTTLPVVPDLPKRTVAPRAAVKTKSRAPLKPRADRSGLDAAERALRELDKARKQQENDFRKRRDDLEAEAAEAQSDYSKQRKAATAAIGAALTAYRDAGGED